MATVTAGTSASFIVAAGDQLFVTTTGSAVVESLIAPAGNAAVRQVVTGQTDILGPFGSDATFKVAATNGDARYANDVRYASDGTAIGNDGPFDGDGRADGSQWNAGGVVYVKRGGQYQATPTQTQAAEFRRAFNLAPSGAAGTVEPIPTISTIVVFGASINDSMLTSNATVAGWGSWILDEYAATVTVVDSAVAGDRMTQFLARIDAALAPYAGNPNVLFCCDLLGGDVTNNLPWSQLSAEARQQFYDDCETIYQKVIANGNRLCVIRPTFRNYDRPADGRPRPSVLQDESLGSLPWIENITDPLSQKYAPDFTFNGVPLLDQYVWSWNNWREFQDPDGIHYTQAGYRALGTWFFKLLCDRLYKGQVAAPQQKIADPFPARQYGFDEVVVSCSNGTVNTTTTIGYARIANTGATNFRPLPRRGYGAFLFTQPALTYGTVQDFNYVDNTTGLTRTASVNSFFQVASGDGVRDIFSAPVTVGATYRVGVMSARRTATPYVTEVSLDGGSTWQQINSSYANTTDVPTPVYYDVTPSASPLVLKLRAGSGGFGFISGYSLRRLS